MATRGLALVLVAFFVLPACAASSPDDVAQRFFGAVKRQDYKAAYALLSPSVQRDLPYGEFERRSRDIKRFAVVQLTAYDRGAHLVKYRVKGRLRLVYKGDLYDAVYAGNADMALAGKEWRILGVELKPIEQKKIGKAPPEYKI